jgi:benzoyl-CoA reductase/2-hydroxyglutaryl-CoA dehydratase subunit BcrC/BadD/HgdB
MLAIKEVTILSALEELARLARTRPEQLKEKKANGAKLVGFTGRAVPEELILASGAVPYLICRGGEPEAVDATNPYILRFMSPYYRAQIGYHLQGTDAVMPMLDLIALQVSDCQEARVADVIEYLNLPAIRLGVPPDWEKAIAPGYYKKRLTILKEKLESLTGNAITDEKLRESIDYVNNIRVLLGKIDRLRKEKAPRLSGCDFIRLNHYSYHADPEVLPDKLEEVYRELQDAGSPFPAKAPRILLVGHVVAIGDYVIPRLIEEHGGAIVAEMLDEGVRHYANSVAAAGDPLDNLVRTYYQERTPPSQFQPSWIKRAAAIKQMVKDNDIDGVVLYEMSFEEIHNMEVPIIAKAMEEINIPFLRLESSYEYSREALGPIVTRIESFIESTKQRRSR